MGSAVGGIAGALIGLGVPELEASRYEEGQTRTHPGDRTLRKRGSSHNARTVLEDFSGGNVFLSGEQRAA